jgi:hypothetical protein
MVKKILILLLLLSSCSTHFLKKEDKPFSGILKDNITWDGEIFIEKDLLIPANVELIIKPGTKIYFNKADSSRTEPIFLLPENEILIRGKMIAKGTPKNPIIFTIKSEKPSNKDWGGIVVDKGLLIMDNCIVNFASSGITAISGEIQLSNSKLTNNYTALSIFENVKGSIKNLQIDSNKTGFIINNEIIEISKVTITNNEEGLIVKNLPPLTNKVEVTKNDSGLIIPIKLIKFFVKGNTVHENKNNVYFYNNPFDKN